MHDLTTALRDVEASAQEFARPIVSAVLPPLTQKRGRHEPNLSHRYPLSPSQGQQALRMAAGNAELAEIIIEQALDHAAGQLKQRIDCDLVTIRRRNPHLKFASGSRVDLEVEVFG